MTERQVSKLIRPIQEKKDDQSVWIIVHSILTRYGGILKRLYLLHFWHLVALDFLFQVEAGSKTYWGQYEKKMEKKVSNGKKVK